MTPREIASYFLKDCLLLDLPILASVWRQSGLLGLPAIDTLYRGWF